MNWYTFIKYSQNWKAYAESLGISSEDMSLLESIGDDKERSVILNEIRKNPKSNVKQLLESIKPRKEYKPTRHEEVVAGWFASDALVKWALVQLRKLRIKEKNIELSWKDGSPLEVPGLEKGLQDFEYDRGLYDEIFNRPQMQQIQDWYNAEQPQMASYTPEEAIRASNEWHDRVSSETEATRFEEGEENVVYGPQWNNPEWNGWTVRQILTANDVQYEGYLMDHCVGSYACDVVDEKAKIYSLRDPGNKPHVTMEVEFWDEAESWFEVESRVEVESWCFNQIHGKSNSEPKGEYKKMIGEWMKTLKNVVIGKYDDFYSNFLWRSSMNYGHRGYKEDIPDLLHDAIFKNKTNDYGIDTNLTYFKFDDAYRSVVSLLTRYWRRSDLTSVLDRIAETLVMATVEKERGSIISFKKNMESSRVKNKYSEKTIARIIDETIRFSEVNDLISKIEEEFERRAEQHLEEQEKYIREEYIHEQIEYDLANALHKELENYLKKNPLPTYSWMNYSEGGPPEFTYYQADSGEPGEK